MELKKQASPPKKADHLGLKMVKELSTTSKGQQFKKSLAERRISQGKKPANDEDEDDVDEKG